MNFQRPRQITGILGIASLAMLFFFGALSSVSLGNDLDDARKLFRTGDYEGSIELARDAVERGVWNEAWPRLLIECYLTTGKYAEAKEVYEAAIQKFSFSLRLRLLGGEVYRLNNDQSKAKETIDVIPELLQRMPGRFTGKDELVPLGEYFESQGEDPKQVLEICYDQAIKEDPKMVEAHLAAARLALKKHDDQVASKSLAKALALDAENPDIYCLLSQAWSGSDTEKATEYLKKAIEINPHHVPSLLIQTESLMNAEQYSIALNLLQEIENVNPRLPKLWAIRAAIGHLQGKFADEGKFRKRALEPWPLNPEVDYTIGKFLADHYRFRESTQYQKRALEMDPNYLPARAQLAQDLLRLGELEEGWDAVDRVRAKDPYDVSIFNLKQLQGKLEKFATLETPGFVVRMDARESRIYGEEVVKILAEARATLTSKYKVELEEPIYVEIFPRQKEFAIRTFGLPGGEGFLGVCFGRLITANSPGALKVDSNWKAVLWHEYCHVVTLQKTKNKMPRWLSEGISVYEERQRDPKWGQSMTPMYREMILGEDLVPVSSLSGAFLKPKSPMHLQFAYYEASMLVEYWIEKYGIESLHRVLNDLAVGMPINESLARYSGGIEGLDVEFAKYIQDRANAYCQGTDFSKLETPPLDDIVAWTQWLTDHPNAYWGRRTASQGLVQAKQWEVALPIVQHLIKLQPDDGSLDGGYAMLATIYRNTQREEEERAALVDLAERSPDCADACMRLIELDQKKGSFDSALQWCQRMIEIQPMRMPLLEAKSKIAEQLKKPQEASEALTAMLELDPIDPSGVHYRLASALHELGKQDLAKRHVLIALEESPRYRDALKLLLKIAGSQGRETSQGQENRERNPQ